MGKRVFVSELAKKLAAIGREDAQERKALPEKKTERRRSRRQSASFSSFKIAQFRLSPFCCPLLFLLSPKPGRGFSSHFYMNPATGGVLYDIDYKVVFDAQVPTFYK